MAYCKQCKRNLRYLSINDGLCPICKHKLFKSYRYTINDYNWFGSDLNKFASEYCSHSMVVNNIDMITYKIYNDGSFKLRIIESKHSTEKENKWQNDLLKVVSNIFMKAQKYDEERGENLNIDIYKISGDFPFETWSIYNYALKETKVVKGYHNLIEFINFNMDFEEL